MTKNGPGRLIQNKTNCFFFFSGKKRPLFRPEGERRPSNGRTGGVKAAAELEAANGGRAIKSSEANGHAAVSKKSETAVQESIIFFL